MARVPAGTFRMGSEDFYPDERPVREVEVGEFWMDPAPVTVREFRRFVKETGHVTVAERPLDPAAYPDADPACSSRARSSSRRRAGRWRSTIRSWWRYVPGACWHAPEGPGSDTYTRGRHPVTHVAHEDALAYAAWAGKALPTEAEWERAARGGLDGARFAWGDEERPDGRCWRTSGRASSRGATRPRTATRARRRSARSPPTASGSATCCGNVWEWTADWFTPTHDSDPPAPCCPPPAEMGGEPIPRRVIKGGSHLCAPSYCLRYRPAARQGEAIDTSTSHLGFRCIVRA